MKEQVAALMKQYDLDALLISGAMEHNPSLIYYIGNDAFFTFAEVLVTRDREPILFHRIMERDSAKATGMKTVCFDDMNIKEEPGLGSRAAQIVAELKYAGLTSGRVAFCGRVEFDSMFAAVCQVQEKLPNLQIVGGVGDSILMQARMLKDADEIERIHKMCKINNTVVGRVEKFIASGHLNSEDKLMDPDGNPITIGRVKSLINLWLGELGAENPEGTIFSMGRDAGVPHSQGNDSEVLEAGKTIVYDFFPCAMGGGYFSDFTRTWCIGYAPDKVKELYAQVKEIHDLCVEAAKPGMPFKKLQQLTCDYFKARGHAVPDGSAVTNGYVHSVGHGLGLNIHENPFSGLSSSEGPCDTLQPGSVFTIEPGLYYPDGDPAFGIRIEDTYYMDKDGSVKPLTDYPYNLVIEVSKE